MASSTSVPGLLSPVKLGTIQLQHKVVMAPLTRFRNKEYVPVHDAQVTYYEQRASKGGLILTEATLISPSSGSYKLAPGIWSDEQIAGWKRVTDAVHKKGGYIFSQLWHLGRASEKTYEYRGKQYPPLAPSPIPMTEGGEIPHELTLEEISKLPAEYAHAAKCAIKAGFDGVEIHSANGYLLDQFIQEVSNKRTDKYGGSAENRHRIVLEVADAVVKEVGAERVGIRFSPFSKFQAMRDPDDKIMPNFTALLTSLLKAQPNLAYVHVVEGRGGNVQFINPDSPLIDSESLDPLRNIVREHAKAQGQDGDEKAGTKFLSAGGYVPKTALALSEEKGDLVVFGRHFIANPDLPERIRIGAELNKYDRDTFYGADPPEKGYTDYPFLEESEKNNKTAAAL